MATNADEPEAPVDSTTHDERGLLEAYLPLAMPSGIVVITVGSVLLAPAPRAALAVMAAGMLVTWIGKKATHHTLTQPLGLLFLAVGIALLIVRQFVGPPMVLMQLALAALLPGVVLAPHGPRAGF